MEIPKYKCSQQELYEACKLLANNLAEHLDRFTAYKGKYNVAFVSNFKQMRIDARAIPDSDIRTADREVLRIELVELVKTQVYDAVNYLEGYIEEIYKNPEIRKVRKQEAGFAHYEAAMNDDWEEVNYLLEQGYTFIETHETELLDGGNNMPATFKGQFETLKNDMDGKISIFLGKKDNSKAGTAVKTRANNDLYDVAVSICSDGQIIFAREPEIKDQFVWQSILDVITPPGAAGLKVYVKNAVTFLPVVGALVKAQQEGEPARTLVTDEDGFGHFKSMVVTNYICNVTGPGLQELNFNVDIQTGVTSTKHLEVMPI
jgi:hypothetical protein